MISPQYTLKELTKNLNVVIQGNENCLIKGVCSIKNAKNDCISFLMNPLYKKFLADTKAAAVILLKEDAINCETNAIICKDPYYVYSQVAQYFNHRKNNIIKDIHQTAVIGKKSTIGANVSIGAYVVVGEGVMIGEGTIIGAHTIIGDGTTIGSNSVVDSHVTLYHDVKIGNNVIIASGTVIGSDGFGIAKYQGSWHKVPQLGRVLIEDDVEIGANCTIDRGAIDDTILKKGAKLDNLIQIGHNVQIGEHTAIAGCVGIAGSTVIGKNCLIGGGTGFAGHLEIADNVMITGMTAVTKSIKVPGIYSSGVGGLIPNKEWRKNSAHVLRIEQLVKRIKNLEKVITSPSTD